MTYDGINIGEAVQPIQDRVETYQSNGYAVISPGDALSAGAYAVTVNSGDIGASDTLSVGSSNDEILFDGSTKSLSSSTNVRINSVSAAGDGTEQYRYDVIYADGNGEVQKTEGSVTKLDTRESQNNLTRFERFKGAIPNPGTDPSVIIGAVIINSNDTAVGSSQLRDYRVDATTTANTVDANNLSGGVTGSTTVSSIIGDGLDIASGALQVLDSIWDAGTTELVANVNNTRTETDTLDVLDVDESPESVNPATSPVDIDVDISNWWQPISATENITVNLNNASSEGNSLLLYFEDGDGNGDYTITWPSSVDWDRGDAITTIPQNGNQRISLTSPDGGTTWYAVDAGSGFA